MLATFVIWISTARILIGRDRQGAIFQPQPSKRWPRSESWPRKCHAMFRKPWIDRLCGIDDRRQSRECANRFGPLSSASPDSSRKFLHAFPIAPTRCGGSRGTEPYPYSEQHRAGGSKSRRDKRPRFAAT